MTIGRPSAADEAMKRAIESGRMLPGQKLGPPADLSDEERAEWVKIVEPLPPGWITAEHDAIMRDLCRHTVIGRRLGEVVTRMTGELAEWSSDDPRWEAFNRMMAEYRAESRLVIALSRSLRITKSAQWRPVVDARRAQKETATLTPWNDWGSKRRPPITDA